MLKYKDYDHELSLHNAVKENKLNEVEKRIDEGVDLDTRDHNSWTPLMEAAQGLNPEMVKLLLDGGANPNTLNGRGR